MTAHSNAPSQLARRNDEVPITLAQDPCEPTAPSGDFRTTEEFARFLRHAAELHREGHAPETLREWLDLAEAWRITQALRACRGNRSAAARALGIGRRTLYAKMDKLDITPTWTV